MAIVTDAQGNKTKICSFCKLPLPLDKFYKETKKPDGLASCCIKCRIERYTHTKTRYVDKRVLTFDEQGNLVERTCSVCNLSKPVIMFPTDHQKSYGIRSYCKKCASDKEQTRRNKAKDNGIVFSRREYMLKYKLEVFAHYSSGVPHCECCGSNYLPHLSIDHINQDGAAHRLSLKDIKGGSFFWKWLKDNNYPDGLEFYV